MEERKTPPSRRQFLRLGIVLPLGGLAGCLDTTGTGDPPEEGLDLRDSPVPDELEDCVSIDGIERRSEGLNAKEDVDYQFHPEYTGESGHIEMCANCTFFCPGTGLEPVGACTEVEGGVRSQDWCALWQPWEGVADAERSGARHH